MQRLGDDELGVGDAVRVLDAVLAQMVGGDVGDDGGIRAGHRQAAAQDAAAGELQHRDLDPGVAQGEAGAAGAGIVAPVQDLVADADPVAGAEAGDLAGGARHGGEQADGGRLAVGAGDQDQRDVVDSRPVDLLGVGQLVVVPGERAGAEADRDPAVALDEGDAAAGGRFGQRHQGGIAVVGDLATDGDGRGFEAWQRGARELGGCRLAGPLVDQGGSVEAVHRCADRQTGAAEEAAARDGGLGPAHRTQHGADLHAPGVDQRVLAADRAGRLQHGARPVEQQARAGEAAGIAPCQLRRRLGHGRL